MESQLKFHLQRRNGDCSFTCSLSSFLSSSFMLHIIFPRALAFHWRAEGAHRGLICTFEGNTRHFQQPSPCSCIDLRLRPSAQSATYCWVICTPGVTHAGSLGRKNSPTREMKIYSRYPRQGGSWMILITHKSASCHFDSPFFEFVTRLFRYMTRDGYTQHPLLLYCWVERENLSIRVFDIHSIRSINWKSIYYRLYYITPMSPFISQQSE